MSDSDPRPSVSAGEIAETALNTYAVVFSLIFGVVSMFSFYSSRQANQQADVANLLAFVQLCSQAETEDIASICTEGAPAAVNALRKYVNDVIPGDFKWPRPGWGTDFWMATHHKIIIWFLYAFGVIVMIAVPIGRWRRSKRAMLKAREKERKILIEEKAEVDEAEDNCYV